MTKHLLSHTTSPNLPLTSPMRILRGIKRLPGRTFKWLTATRKRKILSGTLAVLMLLTSIRFAFFSPQTVKADAFFGFNEGYGTTVNDSNGNLTGTITNAVWKTEDMCKVGKCLYFDGTGDYVSFPDDDSLDMAASDEVTINLWFRTGSISSGTRTLISKYETTGADGGYQIYMNSSGQIVFGIDNDNSGFPLYSVTSPNRYDDNHWHFISAVKNGTTSMSLYINAVHTATTSIASTNAANDDTFYIGIDNALANGWLGFIDEVKIMRSARTADEVKTDYAGQTSERGAAAVFGPDNSFLSEGLVGYWKMDEAAANTCPGGVNDSCDSSGNGFDLAWNNQTTSTKGKYGNGTTYDGTDDSASCTDANCGGIGKLDFGTGASYSYGAWYKTTATVLSNIGSKKNNNAIAAAGYSLEIHATGVAACWVSDGTVQYVVEDSTATNDGEWHHALCVVEGSVVRLYVDGVQVATASDNGSGVKIAGSFDNSIDFKVGEIGSGAQDLNGQVDEFRVYSRALTPSEVEGLYEWAPGPVAYYKFDEGNGQLINDSSGNNLSGTLGANSTPSNNDPTWTKGKFGNALDFDGTNDYALVPTDPVLDIRHSITLMAWVKPRTINYSGFNQFFVKADDGAESNRAYYIRLAYCSPSWSFVHNNSGYGLTDWDTCVEPDEWVHIAGTYDGTSQKLYVNGVLLESTNRNNELIDLESSAPLYFGMLPNSTELFDGIIDEVKIYNYARTPGQVVEDMNAGHPAPGSPVGSALLHYKLDEGYGTTANNSGSGSSLNGTITGASWSNSGKFGKALNFGTSTNNVSAGDTSFTDSLTSMTISLWANPTSLATDKALVSKSTFSTQNSFGVVTDATNSDEIRVYIASSTSDTSNYYTTNNLDLTTGIWTNIIIVYDGSLAAANRVKVYKNGVLMGGSVTGTIPTSMTSGSTSNLKIGASDSGSYTALNSLFDEVKIYSFALTESQAIMDMNRAGAQIFGAGTDSSGNVSWSSASEYCVPGDTATCNPPVGEWKFDEKTGGYAFDTSGNNNTGTLTNGPVWRSAADCKQGACLEFDGTDDYVNMGTSTSLQPSNLTFEAWVKRTGDWNCVHYPIFYTKGSTWNANGWYIEIDDGGCTSNRPLVVVVDGSNYFYITGTGNPNDTYPLNEWVHIAATFNSSTNAKAIFINGISQTISQTGTPDSITSTADTKYIGRNGEGTTFYQGLIDNVRIYDYARTPAQIAWEYNRGGPVGHWRFDECTGETAHDVSGNGNNGTITIGGSGTQTAVGTCTSGNTAHAWYNGRNGKFNASLNFDGTDDYVNMGNTNNLRMPFSLSAWINLNQLPSSTSANYAIVSKYSISSDNNFTWQIESNDRLGLFKHDGSSGEYAPEGINFTSSDIGEWVHAVFTTDISGNVTWYRNGVLMNSGSFNSATMNTLNTANFFIGARNAGGGSNYFTNGQIDDVRVYNYALTEAQIRNVMNAGGAARFGP